MARPDSPRPQPNETFGRPAQPDRIDSLPAGDLARRLGLRIEDVATAILPDAPARCGADLCGVDDAGHEWVIRRRGHKRGMCLCLSRPAHSGDPLVFVTWAHCGGDRGRAIVWAREFLRLGEFREAA
jgi:hypothetical protein